MVSEASVVRTTADAWKALCTDLPVGEDHKYGSPEVAAKTGLNGPSAGRLMRFLRGLGLVSYRSEYSKELHGGQAVFMKRNIGLDEGLTAIYRHFDAGRPYSWFEVGGGGGPVPGTMKAGTARKESAITKETPVVVADERSREEVRAIAGPEPEKPMETLREIRKDEPEALIEAARQYANRGAAVQAKVKELAELGVTVDEALLAKAIHYEVDKDLEAVASVIPYIERLERTNARLVSTTHEDREALRELRREVDVIRKERNDLKAANQRLSERNVALAAQASAKRAEGASAQA